MHIAGRVLKMVTEMGSASIGGISPALSANAAKSFLEATDKEKKEMQGLNDRLGNYIDRVKKLEEQNRKLVSDLEELRGRWGKDTSQIKAFFFFFFTLFFVTNLQYEMETKEKQQMNIAEKQ